jgi:hypothetical protein
MSAQGVLSRDELLSTVEGLEGHSICVGTPLGPKFGVLDEIDRRREGLVIAHSGWREYIPFDEILRIRSDEL